MAGSDMATVRRWERTAGFMRAVPDLAVESLRTGEGDGAVFGRRAPRRGGPSTSTPR
jgi:hypothetical protein